jgi:hypothetical protein
MEAREAFMKAGILFAAALGLLSSSAGAQVVEFESANNKEWILYEQFVNGYFDACIARKRAKDGAYGFSIGRAISGDDFVFVHGMQNLIGANDAKIAGQVFINGKTGYDFSNMEVLSSSGEPGTKYVTIYLADGFIANLASANSIDVQFSAGRTMHGLRGSNNIISKLDSCMEAGLSREMDPVPKPLPTPAGWTAGTAAEGHGARLMHTELPPASFGLSGAKLFMAYVENGQGRYDIRFRETPEALGQRLDVAAQGIKRLPASVSLAGGQLFSTLMVSAPNALDVPDVLPADLAKINLAGPLSLQSLDPSAKDRVDMVMTANAALGAAALQSAPAAASLTLEGLVGRYYVRGRNPDGKPYYGTAETVMENGTLRINWTWRNKKTDTAQANLLGNLLTAVVTGLPDPALYTIGRDGVWRGTWQRGQGSEWAVPRP